MSKTLYLWDLENTLFPVQWNKELTGFDTFEDYLVSIGTDLSNPRQYEQGYREPFVHGEMFNLDIAKGYKEVLEWTKHNETFTTGLKEHLDYRAQYLNPRVGFDIRSIFQKIISTFDYGETNVKTKEMLITYLQERFKQGYGTVVFTDDKLKNCEAFRDAAHEVKGLYYRIYQMYNDDKGLRNKGWYCEIGNLYDLLENEKREIRRSHKS